VASESRHPSPLGDRPLRSLDTSDIIDNNNSNGPQAVEVKPSDKAFLTHGCQTWSLIRGAFRAHSRSSLLADAKPAAGC
jgi:hypothetical protein